MRCKRGFSPISILIGLAVGSVLFLIVMQSLSQITSSLARMVYISSSQTDSFCVCKVLENDFSSCMMPEYIRPQEEVQETVKQEQSSDEKKDKKAPAYFKKAFYVKEGNGLLSDAICISMNTISKDGVVPKKVFYTMQESGEMGGKKVYTLYRQESKNMTHEKPDSDAKKFAVLKNIISLTMTLWARPEKKEKDAKGDGQKLSQKDEQKEPAAYVSRKEWNSDVHYKDQKEKDEYMPLLPSFIDIEIVISNGKGKEDTYSTTIMCASGFPSLELEGVSPLQPATEEKKPASAHKQLDSLTQKTEFSPFLKNKIDKHIMQNVGPYGQTK